MSIKILKPGICTTIQDLGRTGYRSLGISPGGAMDFFAASIANYLAGNDATIYLIVNLQKNLVLRPIAAIFVLCVTFQNLL